MPTSLNEFDANGNLVFDVDRNMQLHYNTRNLPLDIVFDEGLIRNTYRPDGVCRIGLISRFYSMARLSALTASKRICCANSLRISKKTRKMVYDSKGRLNTNETYLGSLVLNFGVLQQILHPEGVVDVSNLSLPVVHYHLKDHLGNVRVVVNPSATNTALISQTNDYYPFGMCYTKNPGSFTNKRKYNGKEEQEMPGCWLDYGARFYDPQLGRWSAVDPLAKDYAEWSPYNYATDGPVNKLDPDGKWVWAVVGAALDYGLQVYDNYQNGSTGYDAWVGDVNFVSVGLSAVNPSGKFKVLKTAVVEVTKAAVEFKPSEGIKVETDMQQVVKEATVNTVVGVGAGKLTDAGSTKAVKNVKKMKYQQPINNLKRLKGRHSGRQVQPKKLKGFSQPSLMLK
ncbi:MAG: RHS repeat-associated core domain-containing protein [Paludibacter sp.]|nr:RHS repeat-associated core domain-containing protein [Paludibacter sp.]